MSKLTIEYSSLSQEHTDSSRFRTNIHTEATVRLMDAAIEMRDRVQMQMPVDTGAAQAVWGNQTLPPISFLKGFTRGIWEVLEGGLVIEEGAERNAYNYIIRLNEGSSMQAPAGFIDAIAEAAAQKFQVALETKVITIL